jgi:hypothetical protein
MNVCMTFMKDWKGKERKMNEQNLPMGIGVCCDRIVRKTGGR